jgi:glycosyltransferase involved in cell wall biosynthesis
MEDWHAYVPMYYLPNYIDLANYQEHAPAAHAGITLGWGGSLSHLQSFTGSGVLAALKRVCRARPQVKVVLCGSDRRIFDQLPLPTAQKVLLPWGTYAEWPARLANFDIGLAPLHGGYDERRSWIKVLEYLVMQIPWVASEGPAYAEFGLYGALVKNTPSAWEHALLERIDHLDDYRALARGAGYQAGLACGIDANIDNVVGTYAAITNQTHEFETA